MEERASEFFSFALQVFALTNWARAQSLKEQLLFITSTFFHSILFVANGLRRKVLMMDAIHGLERHPMLVSCVLADGAFRRILSIVIYNVLLIIILVSLRCFACTVTNWVRVNQPCICVVCT